MARRSALLIGCDTYDNSAYRRLATPVGDVVELAALLRNEDIGRYDDVTLIGQAGTPATHAAVEQAIEAFFRGREPSDLLVLYIGCHGFRAVDGELLFVVKDTQPDLLKSTAISSRWVNRCLEDSRSKRILALLDCCYSGAYPRGSDETPPILTVSDTGRVVITASQAAERAWEQADPVDGRRPRSFFAAALVAGLDSGDADIDGDGHISVLDLYKYVHREMAPVRGLQSPGLQGAINGDPHVAWRRGHPIEVPPGIGPPRLAQPWTPTVPTPDSDQIRVVPVMLPRARGDLRTFGIQRWLHQPGDRVQRGSRLMEVESGGILHYVESPATGVLRVISAFENERVDPSATLGAIVIGGAPTVPHSRIALPQQRTVVRTAVVKMPPFEVTGLAMVTEWWIEPGRRIERGEPLLQVATGPVARDVTSTASGVLRAITVERGESAADGEIVAILAIG